METVLLFVLIEWINIIRSDRIPAACSTNYNDFPFCNVSLSIKDRVNDLISRLRLEEKAILLTARESPLNFIPRLGIPEYDWGTNCEHAVLARCGSKCPTVFPEPNGLGATFNRTLIGNISFAMALELRALWLQGIGEFHSSNLPHVGVDCWAATINIARDPRWGRMFEVPSEDPYWTGQYAKYYTLGMQNGSATSKYYDPNYLLVICTLNIFDAYSLENYNGTTRHTFNAIISDYMFNDTYLPAFKMGVIEGGAKGIMCSYNEVNGVPSCANNFLLKETLRGKWGFNGYITSDSGAINDIYHTHHYTKNISDAVIAALNATTDINSYLGSGYNGISNDYGTSSPYQSQVPLLVNNGKLNISMVDRALSHSLSLRFKLGLFDGIDSSIYWKIPGDVINSKQHIELNIFAARSTQVLLKNDGDILPFPVKSGHKIAVIGPHFNGSAALLSAGDYTGQICYEYGSNDCVPSILTEILKYVDLKDLSYSEGCNVECTSTSGFTTAINTANNADYILLMVGLDHSVESESKDRVNITLPGYQQELASEICKLGKPTVLVLINGGILGIDELKYQCPSILESWYPGFRGAAAINDVIFGQFNPSGKMPVTMYWSNYTKQSDFLIMDLTAGYGKTYKYWTGTKPLFPFGFGLSYTTFQFTMDNITCKAPEYCIDIINIGNREGHETIFVFIYPPSNISSSQPASKMIKHLINFEKFYLEKGEKITYKYIFDKNKDLILYDKNGQQVIFPGNYTLEFTNGVNQTISLIVST